MLKLLKLPRESGYTFLESLLQLMIMLVFVQLFVLFFLWKEPIERHYFDISGTEWQLFAVDFQIALSDVYKIEVHADGRGIRLWNNRGTIDIEQGTAVVRKRVDGSGHVPLLTNIREAKFELNQKTVFVDITMLDGKKKGEGIYRWPVPENERGAMLAVAIILLFFVSLFLFSIVSWHDSLYRTYDSLETYYEKETVKIIKQDG